jgi:ATP-binding cassette subfamily B protein
MRMSANEPPRKPAPALPQHAIRSLLSLVWKQTDRSLRLQVFGTIVLTLGMVILNAAAPVIYKNLVNWFASPTVDNSLVFPAQLAGTYFAIFALSRLCGELRWNVYGKFEQGVQHRLSLLLFDHVHSLSLRYHLERRTGDLQQGIFNGLLGYRLIVFNLLLVIFPLVLTVVLIASVLATFYPAGFVAIMLPMCGLYIATLFRGVQSQRLLQRTGNNAFQDAYARTTDSYLNYETIKLFGSEHIVRSGIDEALARGEQSFVRFYLLRTITGLAQSIWLVTWLAATVSLAAYYVMNGTMTVGDFVLVNAYTLQLWVPLDFLGLAYREIRMGQTNVERMLSVLDETSEIREPAEPLALPAGLGDLCFDNVAFSYDAKNPVLHLMSFSIPAGRTVAVTGPSGAGKSTIARLALRFYDVGSGRITMNGVPVDQLSLKALRDSTTVVPQDTILFNDTLAYNIGIGRQGCSVSEIEEAARIAELHDFIVSLPNGYQTVVGERGLKLSGGQRQRVAIARAVVKRAGLIIFDEATSALDSETEHAIQRNVRSALISTTTLIITHRLSTVIDADEIIVLNKGQVCERGPHDALLRKGGVYADMWRRQQEEAKDRKQPVPLPA